MPVGSRSSRTNDVYLCAVDLLDADRLLDDLVVGRGARVVAVSDEEDHVTSLRRSQRSTTGHTELVSPF